MNLCQFGALSVRRELNGSDGTRTRVSRPWRSGRRVVSERDAVYYARGVTLSSSLRLRKAALFALRPGFVNLLSSHLRPGNYDTCRRHRSCVAQRSRYLSSTFDVGALARERLFQNGRDLFTRTLEDLQRLCLETNTLRPMIKPAVKELADSVGSPTLILQDKLFERLL
jgi:hypothetical protein